MTELSDPPRTIHAEQRRSTLPTPYNQDNALARARSEAITSAIANDTSLDVSDVVVTSAETELEAFAVASPRGRAYAHLVVAHRGGGLDKFFLEPQVVAALGGALASCTANFLKGDEPVPVGCANPACEGACSECQ